MSSGVQKYISYHWWTQFLLGTSFCSTKLKGGILESYCPSVRPSVCLPVYGHNPVTTLTGAILLKSWSNLVGMYLGTKFWPSSLMGDIARWVLNELINDFDLLSLLLLSWVQFVSYRGQTGRDVSWDRISVEFINGRRSWLIECLSS